MGTELRDFLHLTSADAHAQWERIARRVFPAPGKRQEDYLPVEVLLCYALFFELDPHRYGGANIGKAPEVLRRLAGIFKRTPNSLAQKMFNLEGFRPNVARWEPELFARLGAEPSLFVALYRQVLDGGRAAGFSPEAIRVFAEDAEERLELGGQDELGFPEIARALDETERNRQALAKETGLSLRETERVVEQRVRLGQHRFARDILRNYAHRCGFCDFAPHRLRGFGLMRASHVKPWAQSAPSERHLVSNGIAACVMHDAAFDRGLVTLEDDLQIVRSVYLERSLAGDSGVGRVLGPEATRARLFVPEGSIRPAVEFLAHHRRAVFRAAA